MPSSRANDGMVPARSQLWGEVIDGCHGDHLDVVGHYPTAREGLSSDWLPSASGFTDEDFDRVWSSVATCIGQCMSTGAGGHLPRLTLGSMFPTTPLSERCFGSSHDASSAKLDPEGAAGWKGVAAGVGLAALGALGPSWMASSDETQSSQRSPVPPLPARRLPLRPEVQEVIRDPAGPSLSAEEREARSREAEKRMRAAERLLRESQLSDP